jgi:hypothetical protein
MIESYTAPIYDKLGYDRKIKEEVKYIDLYLYIYKHGIHHLYINRQSMIKKKTMLKQWLQPPH